MANVFPVCAGMSPIKVRARVKDNRYPRMRGDEPEKKTTKEDTFMLSPYVRG